MFNKLDKYFSKIFTRYLNDFYAEQLEEMLYTDLALYCYSKNAIFTIDVNNCSIDIYARPAVNNYDWRSFLDGDEDKDSYMVYHIHRTHLIWLLLNYKQELSTIKSDIAKVLN